MNLQVQRSNTARPSLRGQAGRFFVPSLLVTAATLAAPSPVQADIPFNPNIVADVAERVTPAVVNITTVSNRRAPQMRGFQDLFGPRGRRGPQRRMGAGSGVIISADGDIVTNNHVIDGADEIKVTFSNKEEYTAKLVGTDKASDLAFLKIEAKNLPHLQFGSSQALRLGEFVLAIGNPFGVGQTVTMGIVSAKGRANMNIVDYEDFIQTDASINPGNSGGALVNLRGELVGINTAILSRSGGAQGIGFAVPTSMVQPIREQIAKFGRVRRGWLGVSIQDLTPSVAKAFNLKQINGVLVSDILADGPAAKSDLTAGDVIVAVNDKPTSNSAQLRNRIALTRPGSRTKLDVVRDGKSKKVYVTLDEKDDDGVLAMAQREGSDPLAGVRLAPLNREARRELNVPSRLSGVVVVEVMPGSAAERANLDLKQAEARLRQSEASLRQSKSLLGPSVSADLGATGFAEIADLG
ncbi:MAG: Do family serine endopeptidase, partial [Myxococcota bacterium]